MDFTQNYYTKFLKSFLEKEYSFLTFEQFVIQSASRVVILRHDVDKLPLNSLQTAQIENQLGICSSYYFRIVKKSNKPDIINQIADLGHEIGYHYEDMALTRGNVEKAIISFTENLTYFRRFYPVKTICMHGSPMSKYDNRDIWKKYDYREYGIIAEPYFDLDFSKVLYLTDTGRMWDGDKVSVRDKPSNKLEYNLQSEYKFKSTSNIIDAINQNTLPNQIMINTHPQRWTDEKLPWFKELVMQNAKNVVKRLISK